MILKLFKPYNSILLVFAVLSFLPYCGGNAGSGGETQPDAKAGNCEPNCPPQPGDKNTITIRADVWCPYNCEPGSDKPGYMIEIARLAFAKHGIKVHYDRLPWKRAKSETREGKYTAIVGAYKEDAPDFIFPTLGLGNSGNVFWVKKGAAWKYKGIPSLAKVSVGVINDYSYGADLDDYVKKYAKDPKRIQIVSGDDALEKNVKKLFAGRVDSLIEDRNVFSYHMSTNNLTDQIVSAGSTPVETVYIAFSPALPESKRYAQILDEGLRELRSSGKLNGILAKYSVKDWQ